MKKTIEINRPAAMPGDLVRFNNYRAKKNNPTTGRVVHVETHWRDDEKYEHVFEIVPTGKGYNVRVRELLEVVKPFKE